MTRTITTTETHEHVCTYCGSTDLVASQDSSAKRTQYTCWGCDATGTREQDIHCIYAWDERFTGCVGLRVEDEDGTRVIGTAVKFTAYDEKGLKTGATEVAP